MDLDDCRMAFVTTQKECSEHLAALTKFVCKKYMDVSCDLCSEKDVDKARRLRNKLEALVQEYTK